MQRVLLTLALTLCLAGSASATLENADVAPGSVPNQSGQTRSDIPSIVDWEAAGPAGTDVWVVGLGFHNGVFYVTGSDFDGDQTNSSGDNGVYLYDEAGAYLGGLPQPTSDTWGWRDSGYDGSHLYFGASAAHDNQIFQFNPTTLAVDAEFTGCGIGTCRAIAVDLVGGGVMQYKVTGFSLPVETWVWTSGAAAAVPAGSCNVAFGGAYGMAYDSGNASYWVTTSASSGELYELDNACGTKNLYNQLPEVASFGGAVVAQTSHGCNLWTICQCDPTDRVFAWDAAGVHNPFACVTSTPVQETTWGGMKAMYNN